MLFESPYNIIEQADGFVRFVRLPVGYPDPTAMAEEADALQERFPPARRARMRCLRDLRAARGNNSAAFEAALKRTRLQVFTGWERLSALMLSQSGVLHCKRLFGGLGIEALVTTDELAAAQYLRADRSANHEASSRGRLALVTTDEAAAVQCLRADRSASIVARHEASSRRRLALARPRVSSTLALLGGPGASRGCGSVWALTWRRVRVRRTPPGTALSARVGVRSQLPPQPVVVVDRQLQIARVRSAPDHSCLSVMCELSTFVPGDCPYA